MIRPGDLMGSVGRRLRGLPTGVKVVGGVVVAALLAVGSVLMYRTYDYVQHDNQFCLECHLMRDPFEAFAQSQHRGLGCKACHRPNIIERSQMGLAQVIENPDSIRVHAHVPNEVCAECHMEGDPEEWLRVANTAGHRIHFESEDSALAGLQCGVGQRPGVVAAEGGALDHARHDLRHVHDGEHLDPVRRGRDRQQPERRRTRGDHER